MNINRFKKTSDIVEILIEWFRSIFANIALDNLIDSVDIAYIIGIYPNDGNYIEEIPPLVVKLRFRKYSIRNGFKKVVNNQIKVIKWFVLIFLQVIVDTFEQLNRIIYYFYVLWSEIIDTNLKTGLN